MGLVLDFAELAQMRVDVVNPRTLLNEDVFSRHGVNNLPLVNELSDVADLRSGSWNAKSLESPIILVPSNSFTHSGVRVAKLLTVGEWCLFFYLFEDSKDTWASFFDVVLFNSIVWPDECVSVGVHVEHELHLIFVLSQEILVGLRLWLRKSRFTGVKHRTRVSCDLLLALGGSSGSLVGSIALLLLTDLHQGIIFFFLVSLGDPSIFNELGVSLRIGEIDPKVPIKVNTLCLRGCLSQTFSFFRTSHSACVSIFPDWSNLVILFPASLNQSNSVNVENWYEIEFIVFKVLLISLVLLKHS